MPAQLAILLCSVGVALLFYLNRDNSVRVSRALWIPVIWLLLIGSRPISNWFGDTSPTLSSDLDGSPVDAAIYAVLIASGFMVLVVRGKRTRSYLAHITPVIVYFVYCLISVMWSPVPGPSLKRWIKDVGDVVMVLIIVTDTQPLDALRRLYSRVGLVLFPISLVLIRYTALGRAWNNDGLLSIVGVSTDKNMFGLILYAISLGVLWNFRWLLMNRGERNRNRRLVAQGVLLVFGLVELLMSHSSTSLVCFFIGSTFMLATHLPAIRYRPSRLHLLVLALLALGGGAVIFGLAGSVANALGRDTSFSGRTLIWAALLPAVSNPMIGTGFDSFWHSPNVLLFQSALNSQGWYHAELLNEAHNGFLEVYLNLGWIGVCLIVVILTTGYSRALKALGRNHDLGGLMLAYIIAGLIYNSTEAGFREMSVNWIFILLAVVGASGVNAGLFADGTAKLVSQPESSVASRPYKILPGQARS